MRKIIAVLAIAAGAIGLLGTAPSSASFGSPTLTSPYPIQVWDSNAFIYDLNGVLNGGPATAVDCPYGQGDTSQNALSVPIPGVGTLSLAAASCSARYVNFEGDPLVAYGRASIAGANLFSGKLVLGAVQSDCHTDANHFATVGSRIASVNGKPVGNSPFSIVIPGIASVSFNVNTTRIDGATPSANGVVYKSHALEIHVFAHTTLVSGKPVTTPEQHIVIGACSVTSI